MIIHVVTKEDANLLEEKMKDNKVCIVLYYMNGCYYCENMKEEWNKFEKKHSSNEKCNIGKVEMSNLNLLDQQPEIQGYPTICKYVNGKREDFMGERTVDEFSRFANLKNTKSKKPKSKKAKSKKAKSEKGKSKKTKSEKGKSRKAKSKKEKSRKAKSKKTKSKNIL